MSEIFDGIGRNYDIILDSTLSEYELSDMWFYQGDIGGTLTIYLKENGVPMALPPEGKVICFYERKDKQIVQRELLVLAKSESKYVAQIDSAVLEAIGKVKCEIKLYYEDSRTTLTPFEIVVKKSISIEGSVDTPDKMDLIQTVSKNTTKINELVSQLTESEQEIEDIKQLIDSVGNGAGELNDKLKDLQTKHDELVEQILNMSDTVNESLEQLNDSINRCKSDLSSYVDESLEDFNTSIQGSLKSLSDDVATKLEKANDNLADLQTTTEESFTQVSNQLSQLNSNKVTIITSLEEPSTENLPIGTLWIKPQAIIPEE